MSTHNTPATLQSAYEHNKAGLPLGVLGARYGLVIDSAGVRIETKNSVASGFVQDHHADDGDYLSLEYTPGGGNAQKAGGAPNRSRSMECAYPSPSLTLCSSYTLFLIRYCIILFPSFSFLTLFVVHCSNVNLLVRCLYVICIAISLLLHSYCQFLVTKLMSVL